MTIDAADQPDPSKPKLGRFQYRLRTLLLCVLVCAVACDWFVSRIQRAKRQREAVEAIEKSGGRVKYDYQFDRSGNKPQNAKPPGPAWLRKLLGDDFFAYVVHAEVNTNAGLEHLKDLTQLRVLSLSGPTVTNAGLEHLDELTQLRELSLSGPKVTDAELQYIEESSRLQELDFDDIDLTDVELDHLKGLPQLEVLILRGTRVTDQGVKKLHQAMPNCKIVR
jgi:hypothetical protein